VTTSRRTKTHNRQFKTRPISVCECFIVMLKMLHKSLYLQMITKHFTFL